MGTSRFFHIGSDGRLDSLNSLAEALAARAGGGYIWLDYCDPGREELIALVDALGIHPLAVEDCIDEMQIAKVENFPSNTFLLLNAYHYAGGELELREVDLFVGANFVISAAGHDGKGGCVYAWLKETIEHEPAKIGQGPDFLLHLIVDYVVDGKYEAIEALEEEIDTVEDGILQHPGRFRLEHLSQLRRQLVVMRKSLFHEREILIKVCRRDSPFITEKAIYPFRDVYDHLTKFFEETDVYREMTVNLMEMYLSMLNNQMALAANKTNVTLRRLTTIATIFMPMTLVASIGGMSEWSMMTGPENWQVSYPLFILLMAVVGVATYYFIKWLDRKPPRPELLASEKP